MSEITSDSLNRDLIAQKNAEIARLKRRNAQLEQWNLMTDEQVVMDLKAEIERLKEENAHFAWRDADKNRLITALADALASSASHDTDWARQSNHLEIVRRAREATRQEK